MAQLPNREDLAKLWPYLTPQERDRVSLLLSPRLTSYIPHKPTPRQAQFLALEQLEAFFGGAAGGGKSDALLMAALQFADVPNYSAILFRQTYADLALPGALMDRAKDWLYGTDATWSATEKRWAFPSGATLNFGYLESEIDKHRYRSSEFQFIGFDELTNFTESQYRYLFSRLRRTRDLDVPLRMRSASNPGGVGHDWVKARFIGSASAPPEIAGAFVPASLADNPHLSQDEYRRSLEQLDPVTRAQLLSGDWEAYEGGMFQRDWFTLVDAVPADAEYCRGWDKAGTLGAGDWSAGVLVAKKDGVWYVCDCVKGQWHASARDRVIVQTTEMDAARYGRRYSVVVEQEPGSGGKQSAEISVKQLAGYTVTVERVTGDKKSRAMAFASQAGAGNVRIVRGAWNRDWIDEACVFTGLDGGKDDQMDATTLAFNKLALVRQLRAWVL